MEHYERRQQLRKFEHTISRRRWQKHLRKQPLGKRGHSLSRVFRENESRHIQQTHVLPAVFSIRDNPEQVLAGFNEIEVALGEGMPVYIDMKMVSSMSIESIMYLLSIMKIQKLKGTPFKISGNVPTSADNYDLLLNSGFFKFVNSDGLALSHNGDTFEIAESDQVDNAIARNICRFIMERMQVEQKSLYSIYDMVIELMTNTVEHAYVEGMHVIANWYIYVHYDHENREMHFAFLDNGLGIPTTVNKTNVEKIKQWITSRNLLVFGQVDLIEASLQGAFKTRTQEENRGKGMPGIYDALKRRRVLNLAIISNFGYYSESKKMDMKTNLHGTLYYWTMKKECFRANVQNS